MLSLKQTPVWTFARGWKRRLFVPAMAGPLPVESCRAGLEWLNPPAALEAGQRFAVRLRISNLGGVPWGSSGQRPVMLRGTWHSPDGSRFADGPHAELPLPAVLYPGEPRICDFPLTAPAFVGDFSLHFDLAQSAPFSEINPLSQSAAAAIPVVGSRSTDIDYHAVYRTANLADNHWWVVGAYHSREEFERSSRERLDMLVAQGLMPDSHVLDVGCGTGQIAGVLEPYLSDRGAYSGTDIGREAIDYCQSRHRRQNFRFRQGGMTTIPFPERGVCDLAIFFSVFTHVYTDEAALLLGETARLLKPSGAIIADIIVSDLVERCAGHRGEMIVNREHFLRLAALAGFRASELGRWNWNPHAERIMFRFDRS